QATLSTLIELRSNAAALGEVKERGAAEGKLGASLKNLFALVEAYPELRADQSFLQLQSELTEVEEHIQFARRYYNGCVRNLNTRIDSFPDLLIARTFGFVAKSFFELDDVAQAQSPELSK
ncbi:MAG: LemA family protein, partial [Desulfuromonadales bacterium]|nr:LemA family protein [Desulfuromonadales bacterium]